MKGWQIIFMNTLEKKGEVKMEEKKLYRSRDNRMIAGVCGGLGEYFNVDPTLIRLIWALVSVPLAFFGGIVVYIIAAIIIPERRY